MFGNCGAVGGIVSSMENASVHLRMQSFHPAIQHLRESGQIGDVFDANTRIAQQLRRATCGDQFYSHAGELLGKFDQTSLVGNAENGTLNLLRLGQFKPQKSGWGNQKFYQESEG